MRIAPVALFVALTCRSALAYAEPAEPAGHDDDEVDGMNLLAQHHLHDLDHERWNAYAQATYISQWKPSLSRAYDTDGPYSLSRDSERSFTFTATLFAGVALWAGAEIYVVPEVISNQALSNLHGLGGAIQNAELQKQGTPTPLFYLSRIYFRQTIGLGGEKVVRTSDPQQLGTVVDARRLSVTFGNFSIIDFFDRNSFAGDLRRQFMNMSFLTYAAFDFAADARGYTWGAMAEVVFDAWALRVGRSVAPRDPNQLSLNFNPFEQYGDQLEIEHTHNISGLAGVVRILGYRNQERMGRFRDAIDALSADPSKNAAGCPATNAFYYGSPSTPDNTNPTAPDLCYVRRPNVKVGVGVAIEQHLSAAVGVFLRAMISDGRTEVYSYTATDRSLAFGVLASGARWSRPKDLAGAAYSIGWISDAHAQYLNLGGVDGFLGDGKLDKSSERAFEVFYSLNLVGPVWFTVDFQHLSNPGYNGDRGPVEVFGVRGHAEF